MVAQRKPICIGIKDNSHRSFGPSKGHMYHQSKITWVINNNVMFVDANRMKITNIFVCLSFIYGRMALYTTTAPNYPSFVDGHWNTVL